MKKNKKYKTEIIQEVNNLRSDINSLRRDMASLSTKEDEIIAFIRNQSARENVNENIAKVVTDMNVFLTNISKNVHRLTIEKDKKESK